MDDLSREVEELFALVVDLSPDERVALLDERCRENPDLRSNVEELLRWDARSVGFERGTRFRPSDDLLAEEEPGSLIGAYRIVRKLGEGGMGIVYLALQEEPIRREVALKIIKIGMDTRQVIARFEAERQVLAQLDHPGIARVLDAGSTGSGRPYFVMEAVPGDRITDYCDQRGLGIRERLQLFSAVCQAVHHAHLKGIIHRDLKPSNVLIAENEGEPTPKVIDFGVAKATGPSFTDLTQLTEHHQIIGTPEYMSPEQAGLSLLDIDTRSDIYSLGVLLYELLTETTPLESTSLRSPSYAEIQRNILEVDPRTPSRRVETLGDRLPEIATRRSCEPAGLGRRLRGELDWIVMKCLEKERDRRYESALELARDVEHHLSDQPVLAGPPGTAYRLKKFVKRHRAALAASVTGLVLVTLLVVGFVLALYEERGKERLAREEAEWELTLNRVERGRALGRTGSVRGAEELLWKEYFRGTDPVLARWGLWELYSVAPILSVIPAHAKYSLEDFRRLSPDEQWEETWNKQVSDIDFHPEGRVVATAGRDRTIRIWSTETFLSVATLIGHQGAVNSVDFRPDGTALASSGDDGTVRLWDIATEECRSVVTQLDQEISRVRFSPDGSLLASCGWDGSVRFWDAETEVLLHVESTGSTLLSTLVFDRTGTRIAVAGEGGHYIEVWEIDRGREFTLRSLRTFEGHTDTVHTLDFGPDGRQLYSGSRDRTIGLWDIEDGSLRKRLEPDIGPIRRIIAQHELGTLLVGSMWAIERWDADLERRISSSGEGAVGLAVSADQQLMCAGSRSLKFWETRPLRALNQTLAHRGIAYTTCTSPDGSVVATAGQDGRIRLWDPRSRSVRAELPSHTAEINAVRCSADSRYLASASVDGEVRVWDLTTDSLVMTVHGFSQGGAPLAFHPGGRRLASGTTDGTVHIWEVPTGRSIQVLEASRTQVTSLCYSDDGKTFATVARDRVVRMWDGETLESLANFECDSSPWTLAIDRESETLAAGTWEGLVLLWDIPSRQQLATITGQHRRLVRSIVFPPASVESLIGRRVIASGSDDGTVKIWDRDAGCCLVTLDAGAAATYSVGFLPGTEPPHVISTYADGTLGFWDLTYYDRHVAGNIEYQRVRVAQE